MSDFIDKSGVQQLHTPVSPATSPGGRFEHAVIDGYGDLWLGTEDLHTYRLSRGPSIQSTLDDLERNYGPLRHVDILYHDGD